MQDEVKDEKREGIGIGEPSLKISTLDFLKITRKASTKNKGCIDIYYEIFDEKESYVILFLYLLQQSEDYPSNIAKAFEKAIKEEKWSGKKPQALASQPHVQTYLKEMERKGLLFSREDTTTDRKKRYYRINSSVLSQGVKIEVPHKDQKIEILEERGYKHPTLLEKWLSIIRSDYIDEIMCIEEINAIKKYDYLTILTIFQVLILNLTLRYLKAMKLYKEEGLDIMWIQRRIAGGDMMLDIARIQDRIAAGGNRIHEEEKEKFIRITARIRKELGINPLDDDIYRTCYFNLSSYRDYLGNRVIQFIMAERGSYPLAERLSKK